MGYNITKTHFRDIYGAFLWEEPLKDEHRLFEIGESFFTDGKQYMITRVAVVNNTQHVNVELIQEGVNIVYPHL